MENDAGEQGLDLQQLFPYNLLRFFKNSNRTLKKLKQTTTVSRSSNNSNQNNSRRFIPWRFTNHEPCAICLKNMNTKSFIVNKINIIAKVPLLLYGYRYFARAIRAKLIHDILPPPHNDKKKSLFKLSSWFKWKVSLSPLVNFLACFNGSLPLRGSSGVCWITSRLDIFGFRLWSSVNVSCTSSG